MKNLLLTVAVLAIFATSLVEACGCASRPRPTVPGNRTMAQ